MVDWPGCSENRGSESFRSSAGDVKTRCGLAAKLTVQIRKAGKQEVKWEVERALRARC